jgi:hypothetical protein
VSGIRKPIGHLREKLVGRLHADLARRPFADKGLRGAPSDAVIGPERVAITDDEDGDHFYLKVLPGAARRGTSALQQFSSSFIARSAAFQHDPDHVGKSTKTRHSVFIPAKTGTQCHIVIPRERGFHTHPSSA